MKLNFFHPWANLGRPLKGNIYATQGWPEAREGRMGHHGMDIRAEIGRPVTAAGSGTVVRSALSSSAGHWIAVEHPSGIVTRYLHLSKRYATTGDKVTKGQVIGLSGNTGNSAAPHLHYDALVPSSKLGEYIKLFGAPKSGFAGETLGLGVKVPMEPLAPVDEYSPKVTAGAIREGLKLRGSGPAPLVVASIVGIGGAAAWYFYKK